jgi:hypothetical protein
MQTPMFVFAGLRESSSADDIQVLMNRLNQNFAEQKLVVKFTRKELLLIANFDDVQFYVSLFSKNKELRDWFKMAKDFELVADPNPIDDEGLSKRYEKKKIASPELYNDIHYLIGQIIFSEISKFDPVNIYLFQ